MKRLLIQNKGEVEVEAFNLMGASTKRGDSSKIGMFGSGTKFGIACMLREQLAFRVFSGTTEIKITTNKKTFRGEQFDVIRFNGVQSSLTIQMGKDWSIWQSLRELYANAIDEEEGEMTEVTRMTPKAGYTNIYIEYDRPEVIDFIRNKNKYFSDKTPELFKSNIGRILPKASDEVNIYRKGIKCNDDSSTSLFDYDLNHVSISESRTLTNSWSAAEEVWKMIFECNVPNVINSFIESWSITHASSGESFSREWENERSRGTFVSIYHRINISDEWVSACEGKWFIPRYMLDLLEDEEKWKVHIVSDSIYDVLKHNLGSENILPPSVKSSKSNGNKHYKEIEVDGINAKVLEAAHDFLMDSGLNILGVYPIVVAKFSDSTVLGTASDGKIIVGIKSLERGIHDTINTIIEEYVHLKSGHGDETRGFQTALINELINYIKTVKEIVV